MNQSTEIFKDNPNKNYDSLIDNEAKPLTGEMGNNDFILDVQTYVLILELAHIDMERKCAKVWVELGFLYDVHDYLRTFDSMVKIRKNGEDLDKIAPDEMQIPFDIVNALDMEMRSEAHFIREHMGDEKIKPFYTESKDFNKDKKLPYLSQAKNMVNFVNFEDCPKGRYWKHETRTYSMEISFYATERLAPFDEIHLFFKLITANCQPGTNRIRFNYDESESDFAGFKHPIQGYCPLVEEPHVHCGHTYSNDGITWDRLYISMPFKRKKLEDTIKFYVVPFLSYYYMVIVNIDAVEELLAISSTLVIANVALLITVTNNVFAFYEQAILIQILILVGSTLILSYFNDNDFHTRILLAIANAVAFFVTLSAHWFVARKENNRIRGLISEGKYSELNTI